MLDVCHYHQVLWEFWLHVAIKDILGLNGILEHAQNEYVVLVWAVSVFGNGLYMKCSLKVSFLTSVGW